MISNQAIPNPTNKNVLTQYGILTLSNVQLHAATYIGQQNQAVCLEQVDQQILAVFI